MEEIKLTQTQTLSSVFSSVGESADDLTLEPVVIDERLIADEVLDVRQGHRKSVGRIVKGKEKASVTSYSTLSSGSQSQAAEEHRRFGKRLDTQQHKIDTLKVVIAQLTAGRPQPLPEDPEDLGRDQVLEFCFQVVY